MVILRDTQLTIGLNGELISLMDGFTFTSVIDIVEAMMSCTLPLPIPVPLTALHADYPPTIHLGVKVSFSSLIKPLIAHVFPI
uniref:CSON014119 protein n=1 Tax=Culicoides sonorensis TaxID=179676 RepID=A0A336KTE6_CULSO